MLNMHVIDVHCSNATLAFEFRDSPNFILGPFSFLTLHSCFIETTRAPQPDAEPLDLANVPALMPDAKAGAYDGPPERALGYWAQAPMPSFPATLRVLGGRVYSSCEVCCVRSKQRGALQSSRDTGHAPRSVSAAVRVAKLQVCSIAVSDSHQHA